VSFEVDPAQLPLLAEAVRSFSASCTAAGARMAEAPLSGVDLGAVSSSQEALHQLFRWREYAHDAFVALAATADQLGEGLDVSAAGYLQDDASAASRYQVA
jgi:hypothetical protein